MVFDKQFIFIIGSPRSGTTWLQIMIGAHPSVCTSVELTMFELYITPWLKSWRSEAENIERGRWHRGLPYLWNEEQFFAFLKEFLQRVYIKVLDENDKATHILDKNPLNASYTELIRRFIPNCRFIHIIRDGRDAVASMLAARKIIGFGPGTIQEASIMWKTNVQSAREAVYSDGQYMELRYEDILNDGETALRSVFDFCELDADDDEIFAILNSHQFKNMRANNMAPVKHLKAPAGHYRKGKAGSWREDLKPLEKYRFNRIAGDLLAELGYGDGNWWASSRADEILLPLLAAGDSFLRRLKQSFQILADPLIGKAGVFRRKT